MNTTAPHGEHPWREDRGCDAGGAHSGAAEHQGWASAGTWQGEPCGSVLEAASPKICL